MTEIPDARVTCPACGRKYRWVDELAGRKLKCNCGAVMRLPRRVGDAPTIERKDPIPVAPRRPAPPIAPPPAPPEPSPPSASASEDADSYDLDLPESETPPGPSTATVPARKPNKCPSCGLSAKPNAVICLNCGYNFAQGTKLETAVGEIGEGQEDPAVDASKLGGKLAQALRTSNISAKAQAERREQERRWKMLDIYIPAMLTGVGLLCVALYILFGAKVDYLDANGNPLNPNFVRMLLAAKEGVTLMIQLPFLLASLFIVARLFGTSFGTLGIALLKLLALAIFLMGMADMIWWFLDWITEGFGFMGGMISSSIQFGIFWVMAAFLFSLEGIEIFVLYVLANLLPVMVAVFLASLLFTMLHP